MDDISKKEQLVFNNLINFADKHGYQPSYRELCDLCNIPPTSLRLLQNIIQSLENKKYIKKTGSYRAIEILKKGLTS